MFSVCIVGGVAPARSSDSIYMMTLNVRTKNISNNSVGNEWSFKCYVDGAPVKPDTPTTVYLNSDSLVMFKTVITEKDDSYSDTGSAEGLYLPSMTELYEGFKFSHKITVIEKGGKYAGNRAVWEVTYTFSEYSPSTSKGAKKESSSNVSAHRSTTTRTAPSETKKQTSNDGVETLVIGIAVFLVVFSPYIIAIIAAYKKK